MASLVVLILHCSSSFGASPKTSTRSFSILIKRINEGPSGRDKISDRSAPLGTYSSISCKLPTQFNE
ncbi:unnamed protein product [Rhizophagus irregularis]|nr:unnamed protein product [Rhizophagus irregularis]